MGAVAEGSGGIKTPKLSGLLPLADPQLGWQETLWHHETGWGALGVGERPSSSQAGSTGGQAVPWEGASA